VKRVTLLALAGVAMAVPARSQVIDVGIRRGPDSFETLWVEYLRADRAGDAAERDKYLREITRLRAERNIQSLEDIGLALVAKGLESLKAGDRDKAEQEFRRAIALDPHLPDGYFGLALAALRKGPVGVLQALVETFSAFRSRLSTIRGRYALYTSLVPALLLAGLAFTGALALTLLLRHGGLLLHDLEEAFGQGRGRLMAKGVFLVLLLLPLMTLQGYAWLPLWWLTLMFLYVGRAERALIFAVLAGAVAVGPLLRSFDAAVLAFQNPLFRAAVLATEGGPDGRAIADLQQARQANPDDRDLAYLLGIQYKKAGRYDEAFALYDEILRREDESDVIAKNNLANIHFAREEYSKAIGRYRQCAETGGSRAFRATFLYNRSLAHYRDIQFPEGGEARSQADAIDGSVTRAYEQLWWVEKEKDGVRVKDGLVVDLGLTPAQVWAKFDGQPRGIGRKNVAREGTGGGASELLDSLGNRFTAFLGVFAIVTFVLSRWRGKKTFTLRCLKCGMPFCKRCHLGAAPSGLCTQCYHLFVVRDGVSGPARNQKLLEVQREEGRRDRVFRLLSLLSPGAGHLYAQRTVLGALFLAVWYGILALLLAGRLLPVTDASSELAKPWPLVLAGVALLALYVIANRARPDYEVAMPVRRGGPSRRGRAA
jgi:tetratricopeptide (TPR) repeat protein